MPATFVFGNTRPLDPTKNYRAYAQVIVFGRTGVAALPPRRRPTHSCLVDSGSDYTILPATVATALGLSTTGPGVTIATASGATYTLPKLPPLDLEIEGILVSGEVLVSSAIGFQPLLGRPTLLSAFDFAFDTTDWHFEP